MRKTLIAIAVTALLAAAHGVNAQISVGSDPGPMRPRTHGWPPGPPGSWSNPIRVHTHLGEAATMGNFALGTVSPWYWVTGWDSNDTNHGGEAHIYYDLQTPHWGQFLTKIAESADLSAEHIYLVYDSNPPHAGTYYRLIEGPTADPGNSLP